MSVNDRQASFYRELRLINLSLFQASDKKALHVSKKGIQYVIRKTIKAIWDLALIASM